MNHDQIITLLDEFQEKWKMGASRTAYFLRLKPYQINNLRNQHNWNPSEEWLSRIPPRIARADALLEQISLWCYKSKIEFKISVDVLLGFMMETHYEQYNKPIEKIDAEWADALKDFQSSNFRRNVLQLQPQETSFTPDDHLEKVQSDLEEVAEYLEKLRE